eukprot:6184440-Pleurochrysis_carterae.AAC.2
MTLLVSPGLAPSLRSLADLRCEHRTHASIAGGHKEGDMWTSAHSSAYPPDLNFLFAKRAMPVRLTTPTLRRQPRYAPRQHPEPRPPPGVAPSAPATPATLDNGAPAENQPRPETQRNADHFQRGLGAYQLRERQPTALLLKRAGPKPSWGRGTGCAFAVSHACPDPRTRK